MDCSTLTLFFFGNLVFASARLRVIFLRLLLKRDDGESMNKTILLLVLLTGVILRLIVRFPDQSNIDIGLLMVLPLFAAAYWVLREAATERTAYLALSPSPLVIAGLLFKFGMRANHWTEMLFPLVLYTSAMLLAAGAGLTVRAYRSGHEWSGLLLGTCLAGLPVLLMVIQIISIANDPEFDKASPSFN